MSNLSDFLVGKGYGLKEVLTSSGTWNWTTAGKPKKVFAIIVGAGGGAAYDTGSIGTDGGDTVFDGQTASGGDGANYTGGGAGLYSNNPSNDISYQNDNNISPHIGKYGKGGYGAYGSALNGASGEVVEYSFSPSTNVSYTIGSGGVYATTSTAPYVRNGEDGAIFLYY
tara:strand:- start:1304 stop:1810 length:507 start_codon:yes stop_codon:yes gene_type:complete